ncbi:MAG: hypothetical protein AAFX02_04010, partial [Pseudomonadota bacterium]
VKPKIGKIRESRDADTVSSRNIKGRSMLDLLIRNISETVELSEADARSALGVLLNAAERQGAPFAETLFRKMPGSRTLSASTGDKIGAATGVIARLIEQTPGGRRHVAAQMISDLQEIGLGHREIGRLLPSVSSFLSEHFEITDVGHLGDLLGSDLDGAITATTTTIAA